MSTPLVSIVIPTFHRSEGLIAVVESILTLPDQNLGNSEIVIVDNSEKALAEATTQQLAASTEHPIKYVSEPNPGVSNARNAGLSAASSHLIAFIDDDETALPGWLDGLLIAHETLGAAVVFGPVLTVLPESTPKAHTEYLSAFFSRNGPSETKLIEDSFGCGNTLLDLDRIRPCIEPNTPFFNKIANESGGEDDYLFAQVRAADEKFAWAHTAQVNEHVPAKRAKLSYTMRRAFGYGQGPTTTCWRKSPKDIKGILFWMTIGLGQAAVYGSIAGILYIARSNKRAKFLDLAVKGLGKAFWFPPFTFKFYGSTSAPS